MVSLNRLNFRKTTTKLRDLHQLILNLKKEVNLINGFFKPLASLLIEIRRTKGIQKPIICTCLECLQFGIE